MRTTPNSYKETASKSTIQDFKKQQSQPIVSIPETSQLFHIPQKYCQQRFKPQPTVSKSIEEKRIKKNNTDINNRTNSSSKSRISALTGIQMDDDSMYSSQNQLKLKKIIGDSQAYNIQQFQSKQNITCDSSSPAGRQNKSLYKKSADIDLAQLNLLREQTLIHKKTQSLQASQQKDLYDQLINLDKSIQGSLQEQQKKQIYLKQRGLWEPFKDLFCKQFGKIPFTLRSTFNQISIQVREVEQQWSEMMTSITNNLFELLQNSAIIMAYEQDLKLNELLEKQKREKDHIANCFKSLEQERDILLETVSQLKCTLEQQQQQYSQQEQQSTDTIQLKEMATLMQQKIQEMSEKESKLIKLVLAIRRTGIDIEKIYNEEVLNEDSLSIQEQNQKSDIKQTISAIRSENDADNSVINDSDESSFCYDGRLDNESIIESIRRFENRTQNNYAIESKSSLRMKIDLSKCNQQQQTKQQMKKQTKINQLKIPHQEGVGFHQEFLQKFNEFSESWRVQLLKDEKRTKN